MAISGKYLPRSGGQSNIFSAERGCSERSCGIPSFQHNEATPIQAMVVVEKFDHVFDALYEAAESCTLTLYIGG